MSLYWESWEVQVPVQYIIATAVSEPRRLILWRHLLIQESALVSEPQETGQKMGAVTLWFGLHCAHL
jgi:hypothetical protein